MYAKLVKILRLILTHTYVIENAHTFLKLDHSASHNPVFSVFNSINFFTPTSSSLAFPSPLRFLLYEKILAKRTSSALLLGRKYGKRSKRIWARGEQNVLNYHSSMLTFRTHRQSPGVAILFGPLIFVPQLKSSRINY